MSNETQLLQKLESCIKRVGNEWNEMEDVGFFSEADLRAKLLSLLWAEPDLVTSVLLEPPGKILEIPLAHAECLGAKGRSIARQGPFDIAVFSGESIKVFAEKTRWLQNWQEELRKLEVVAVIEIKVKGDAWNDDIRKDLDKLVERVKADPIAHGYLLVFFDAKKKQLEWADIKNEITQKRASLGVNKDVKAYFAPCGNPSILARWI